MQILLADLTSKLQKKLNPKRTSTIAKNIWDAKAYYKILSEEDEFIQEAINKLN